MEQETVTGKERRQFIRLDRELMVHFKIIEQSPEQVYDGKTCNISQGGVCIEVDGEIENLVKKLKEIKPVVHIAIELTDLYKPDELKTTPQWINGLMFWVKKPFLKSNHCQIGLAFQNIEEKASERIHNYIMKEFVASYGNQA
jgi:hypothetical protein